MKFLFPLLLCLTAFGQQPLSEAELRSCAFMTLTAGKDVFYRHERVTLRLGIGYDPEFFRTRAIQLYRREFFPPLAITASWLGKLAGARLLSPPVAVGPSLVVNGELAAVHAAGEKVIGGKRYTVLEINQTFLPEQVGELIIPAVVLRFAYANEFRSDLARGRVPVDKHFAEIKTPPLRLRVDPLPEAGQPLDFKGAVGEFVITAQVDRQQLKVGESLRLTLTIMGEGNLALLSPPRLVPPDGFNAYGQVGKSGNGQMAVSYDLVPMRAEVKALPPIPFSFFTPGQGYRRVYTKAIPLQIMPLPTGSRLRYLSGQEGHQAKAGVDDIYGLKNERKAFHRVPIWDAVVGVIGLLHPWLVAGVMFLFIRSRQRALADPGGVRARAAAVNFFRQLEAGKGESGALLVDYLAARLRCSQATVVTPELESRLVTAGIPPKSARGVATLLGRLTASRYGGTPTGIEAADLADQVAELEELFKPGERKK